MKEFVYQAEVYFDYVPSTCHLVPGVHSYREASSNAYRHFDSVVKWATEVVAYRDNCNVEDVYIDSDSFEDFEDETCIKGRTVNGEIYISGFKMTVVD